MNKPHTHTDDETDEKEDESERITVELTETECVLIQHALMSVIDWNYSEDDDALAERHNDCRELLIDAHNEWLADQRWPP